MIWIIAGIAVLLVARALWFRRQAQEAKRLVAQGAVLLDVRSPAEFAAGHIEGARNIPVQELQRRANEVGTTATPVVVYCASGTRSMAAAAMLRRAGFAKVVNMGPMSAWR